MWKAQGNARRGRRKIDIRKIGTKKLYHSLGAFNTELYMVFVILALLAQFEVLQLTPEAQRTSISVNLFCSNSTFWPDALSQRVFVASQIQNYEVRDSTLNGICSSGTISYVGLNSSTTKINESASCEWTMYATDCSLSSPLLLQVVQAGYQTARRSGLSFETARCDHGDETTTVLCRDYHLNQQVCIDAAIERVRISHIIGILGL